MFMSDSDLRSKVVDWLERTGLPLEMETATEFQKAGFTVAQSSIYADPESERGREIDVVAHARDRTGMVQIYFAAECKASPNPWVVLETNVKPFAPPVYFFGVGTLIAREAILEDLSSGARKLWPFVQAFETGGYALRQAFSKDSDPAYAAVMSAIKASSALAAEPISTTPRLVFALPVLVVDSPLFECRRSAEGKLTIFPTEMSQFYFTAMIPERTSAVVRVVTKRSLPTFVKLCRSLSDNIIEAMQPRVDQWVATITSKQSA